MTAYPDHDVFYQARNAFSPDVGTPGPNVTEHYWGYEIMPSEHVIDGTVLLRAFAVLAMISSALGAVLLWLLPSAVFVGDAVAAKGLTSVVLILLAGGLLRIAGRGTRVRLQVNTSAGELVEVVDGPFGSDADLARYGFDAVERVFVRPMAKTPAFGQIILTLKDGTMVPAGDGATLTLDRLRARLVGDLGLDHVGALRETIWSGPRAA